jgi:hypothetical protein
MRTVTIHTHNLDRTAHIVWQSHERRAHVYRVKAGFIAVHLGSGAEIILVAEPIFLTLDEARSAAFEIADSRRGGRLT